MKINDKLKPSQPFFVLNSEGFIQRIYREQGISHFYSFCLPESTDLVTVPDGCIDFLFEYTQKDMRAYACGSVTRCGYQHWEGKRDLFGVRFLPGYLPACLELRMGDLIDKRVLLDDLLYDRRMIERMAEEKDFHKRISVFLEEYIKVEERKEKPYGKLELCMYVKDLMYHSGGLIKIHELSERTGYSERYINKVFDEVMGFSPKTFCKIIQFQNTIEALNYGHCESMTQLAMDMGYYDQAKFIRDFKKYAGITPAKYLKLVQNVDFQRRVGNL